MSVQQNHYVMVGKKFGFKEFAKLLNVDTGDSAFERVEEYIDNAFKGIHHHNDLCVLFDGMNGEHVVVGRVLQKSGNYGSLSDFKDDRRRPSASKVSEWIKREFGFDVKCSLISITHFR